MWSFLDLDNSARGLALCSIVVILIGTLVGSMAPEFGNIVAKRFDYSAHEFNRVFLVLGISGVMLALLIGYKSSS